MSGAYGYTPRSMLAVADSAHAKLAQYMKRGNIPPADVRYMLGGLENIKEVLQFVADHEAAISKAAKRNVPWRKP